MASFSSSRWALLLALSPAAAFAQTAPRLYVGASAALVRTSVFDSYSDTRVGPAATVGVAFNSRWALETGALFTWYHAQYGYLLLSSNSPDLYSLEEHDTRLIVPLLARYTFTAEAARWHLDALAGLSWVHGNGRIDYNTLTNTTLNTYTLRGNSDDLGAVLGPQVRYTLANALDLKLSLPVNMYVTGESQSFGDRIFLTPQLGAQYTFGH